MSTRKANIRKALREHFLLVEGIPDDINWEGKEFTPPQSGGDLQPYIRETLLPADEVKSANGERMAFGIFEWDLFFPLGQKLSIYENLADDIKEKFEPFQTLDNFLWIERCFVGQGQTDPPWYIIPIRGDYRSFET